MPEEINRTLSDHCADYLFAPTEKAKVTLLNEGIAEEKIFVTGNTIVDAVYHNLEIAKSQETMPKVEHINYPYFLLTLHRQENVDNPERFASIIAGLNRIAAEYALQVVYPIHPRSRKMMKSFNLEPGNMELIEPVDFLGFLQLENNARLILTDSGGVQEEACILKIPCVTLRDNTERPETVDIGANILAGVSSDKILDCVKTMLSRKNNWTNPFGDGKAGERIVNIISGR
jgi:UDP-N-acetylglucosamine 2-epimerase (non-hydrolysing)